MRRSSGDRWATGRVAGRTARERRPSRSTSTMSPVWMLWSRITRRLCRPECPPRRCRRGQRVWETRSVADSHSACRRKPGSRAKRRATRTTCAPTVRSWSSIISSRTSRESANTRAACGTGTTEGHRPRTQRGHRELHRVDDLESLCSSRGADHADYLVVIICRLARPEHVQPVDRILERARHRSVVHRAAPQHLVRLVTGLDQSADDGRRMGLQLRVGDRQFQAPQVEQLDRGSRRRRTIEGDREVLRDYGKPPGVSARGRRPSGHLDSLLLGCAAGKTDRCLGGARRRGWPPLWPLASGASVIGCLSVSRSEHGQLQACRAQIGRARSQLRRA